MSLAHSPFEISIKLSAGVFTWVNDELDDDRHHNVSLASSVPSPRLSATYASREVVGAPQTDVSHLLKASSVTKSVSFIRTIFFDKRPADGSSIAALDTWRLFALCMCVMLADDILGEADILTFLSKSVESLICRVFYMFNCSSNHAMQITDSVG